MLVIEWISKCALEIRSRLITYISSEIYRPAGMTRLTPESVEVIEGRPDQTIMEDSDYGCKA